MEIRDYIRAKGWLFAVPALLPLFAGACTFVVLSGEPDRYRGQVELGVPGSGSGATGQYVANFRETARSPRVLDPLAARLGTRPAVLEEDLQVEQVGQASRLAVTATAGSGAAAGHVAEEVARATLAAQAQDGLRGAERRLQVSEDAHDASRATLDAFVVRTGLPFPQDAYREADSEVRRLQGELATAENLGDAAAAATLRRAVEDALDERDRLVALVQEHARLEEDAETGAAIRRDARRELVDQRARVELATAPDAVAPAAVVREDRTDELVQGVGLAVVAAFLLGLAVVVVPDLLRPPQRPATGRRDYDARDVLVVPEAPAPSTRR